MLNIIFIDASNRPVNMYQSMFFEQDGLSIDSTMENVADKYNDEISKYDSEYLNTTKLIGKDFPAESMTDPVWNGLVWVESSETPNILEAKRIAEIKLKTLHSINVLQPAWKQRNLIVRGLELTEILAINGILTANERTEFNEIKTSWAQIRTIRILSDRAEEDGTLADDFNP